MKSPNLYFILVVIGLVTTLYINPILGTGVILIIFFHELGHAIVAKLYRNFESFFADNKAMGVKLKRRPETFQEKCCTSMSGLLVSVVALFIVFYIGASFSDLLILFVGGVVGSAKDFQSIVRWIRRK